MRRHVPRALGPILLGAVVTLLAPPAASPRESSSPGASLVPLPRSVVPFTRSGDALRAGGALPVVVDADGAIAVSSRGVDLTLSLASIGRGHGEQRAASTRVEDGRALVSRGDVREWLVATATGLEHGFDLARRIAGEGDVSLRLAVSGATARPRGRDAELVDAAGSPRFAYRDLVVVDAAGRTLPSSMRAEGDAIVLGFDDRGATYPVRVDPLLVTAFATLSEAIADQEVDAQCGFSVAIDGNVAIVGCPADDAPGPVANVGSVLVFSRPDPSMAWSPAGRLTPPLAVADARFGHAVAYDGTTLVVGAPGLVESMQTDGGVAYAFRNTGSFMPFATVYPPRVNQAGRFGHAVAVSGDVVVVGAPEGSVSGNTITCGTVTGYTITGGVATFVGETAGPSGVAGDRFGESLSLRGTTLVVGAPQREGPGNLLNAGAAYVFVANATGVTSTMELVDPAPVATGRFGADVASSSAGFAIGKPHGDAPGLGNTGTVVVYGSAGALVREIAATDRLAADAFGVSVAMEGPFLLVGASASDVIAPTSRNGGAYLFVQDGTRWIEAGKLVPSDAALGDLTGFDVAVDATSRTAMLGVPRDGIGSTLRIGSAKTAQIPAYRILRVEVPNGGGSVASTPAGIACPTDCDEVYGTNAAGVGLVPTAFAGYYLAGVEGACDGIPCSVTMTENRSVSFDFQPQRDLGEACAEGVECLSGSCTDGVCCNEACAGGDADCQACSIEAGGSVDGTCGALVDDVAPTVVCRVSAGPCDVEETCAHASRSCPANLLVEAGVECRAARHPVCDTAEACTGSSVACPLDAVASAETSCDDGSACTGVESCDGAGACLSTSPVQCVSDGNPCTVDLCLDSAGCVSVEQPGCIVVDGGAFFPAADAGTSNLPRLEGEGGCACSAAGSGSGVHPGLGAWFALLVAALVARRFRARTPARIRRR